MVCISSATAPGLLMSVTSFLMYWPPSLDTQMAWAVASVQYMFEVIQSTTSPVGTERGMKVKVKASRTQMVNSESTNQKVHVNANL